MRYKTMSPKQRKAMLWWADPKTTSYDAIICDGSVRSGKTMSMSVGFLIWSLSRFDHQTFALCGKTIDSLKRNVITPLQTWVEGIFEIRQYVSRNYLEITDGSHTNRYYLFGGKDESSAALIQGITLAGAFLDEVALMPRSFVEQAVARCSVSGSRLWFNCNPDSAEHWFYKEWICKKAEKNALHLHFTMQDNYALDKKIRERYERLYTGVFYDRYIKGLWCMAEGLVYPNWSDRYVLHGEIRLSQNVEWYIAIDYGTINPFSAGLWAVSPRNAFRVAEYYYNSKEERTMRTDEEHYAALEQLAGDRPIQHVIVDPSAASFIECIRRHGRFTVRKAHNEVLPGISRTATLIQNGRILIHESCRGILREFALYRWDDKATDKVIKENDHCMDEMRYLVNTVLRRTILADIGGDVHD